MPSRVYTFSRDRKTSDIETTRLASTDAIISIAVASAGLAGISYEELTESHNPRPMVAVSFTQPTQLQTFSNRLSAALHVRGLRIRKTRVTPGAAAKGASDTLASDPAEDFPIG